MRWDGWEEEGTREDVKRKGWKEEGREGEDRRRR